ncbi:peptidase M16 [candidate division KSB1 bacterium RBG_16_48_16]|nr:MAG: peptidase M16 [candidate division KSB1 bacterium RBG_16_48_16]
MTTRFIKTAMFCSAFLSVIFCPVGNTTATEWDVAIPYQKLVLENGLTLVVHEDHKAPIVAVNVWYHVGSKNEKIGKTGFAHLFEHLMFNGSEHFNDDYFQALERVGATDLNGTTNKDRTNYFQNVPTSALDVALWMESDRMGHLLGAIDQAKLDEQRGVVQNEKRQGENRPYGRKIWHAISQGTYPANHPYSWETIGYMEDLDAASLDDVYEWFRTYYGAANSVLVIAGDVNVQEVKEKVESYFGDIPAGPPITKFDRWVAKRSGKIRQTLQDRVPQARIYKVWNIPEWASEEADYLDLITDILAAGKTSRLYKRLVYQDQIATDVYAYVDLREIAGQLVVQATARPGDNLSQVEKAVDEELAKFLQEGPTEKELARVKTQYRARFVRGIERIGGFGGKSDVLAMSQVFAGNPDHYKTKLERIKNVTAQQLKTTANTWLSDGEFILEVIPFPDYKTKEPVVDRSGLPATEEPPIAKFPDLQRAILSNGLKIVLIQREGVPLVDFNLLIDAGYAADQFGQPGTANLALSMLDEGTTKRTSLQISEELSILAAQLDAWSDLDMSYISLSSLKENVDKSLEIYADVILNPSFAEQEFQRLKKEHLAAIKNEKTNPGSMAVRILPQLLYGKGHAYGNPGTGSGFEETVEKLTREELVAFHRAWFKPNHATLIIVGATGLEEMIPRLEKSFAVWQAGETPKKNVARVEPPVTSAVYLLDRPDAPQSYVVAAQIAPLKSDPDEIALDIANHILGGSFTSRINMNLREDKHWSYGARSTLRDASFQRPFLVTTSVQSDKTKETVSEILKEVRDITADRPPSAEELVKAQKSRSLRLSGQWETIGNVMDSAVDIVRYNLPDDYFRTYPEKILALQTNDLSSAARDVFLPDKLIWIVVGDRAKIEDGLRELAIGEVHIMDADGRLLDR